MAEPAAALPEAFGRARPVITGVRPTVDGGRYPAKGSLGETVVVEADIFADGHDELLAEIRFRRETKSRWRSAPLTPLGNDRWRGEFPVRRVGRYQFAVWATGPELGELMSRYPDPGPATVSEAYPVEVERARARFSSWYEIFPRSASPDPARPGTLADVEALLPYVSRLGFDVLYLPPIHPIGITARKGPNGAGEAGPGDPGSPWAIGGGAGGHTAVPPELGTLADFDRLVTSAAAEGIEVALDLTFQCSPDHPWVTEHPEWFRRLPDGSIRTAENPPKRYEDVGRLEIER